MPNQQDSLPEFLTFANQSSNIGAFKDQSRFSLSPAPNKRHSCPPIPYHGTKRSSPARNGSPMNKFHSPSLQNHVYKSSPHGNVHGGNVFATIMEYICWTRYPVFLV